MNENLVAQRIYERRKHLRMSAGTLANLIGRKHGRSVRLIETGENDIHIEDLPKIANALQTSIEYLIGQVDIPDANPEDILNNIQIPIIGTVAAGNGAYADNNIIGYEDIPKSWVSDGEQYVLLKVQGDSMYPEFKENDLLLVRPQSSIDSGSYAVVLIDDDNGVVKKVTYTNNSIDLISVNPMYPPRRFEGPEVQRVKVFGLVKKCIRNI